MLTIIIIIIIYSAKENITYQCTQYKIRHNYQPLERQGQKKLTKLLWHKASCLNEH